MAGEVDRLQGSLASANAELTRRKDQISRLQSQVSQLTGTAFEDQKHGDNEDDIL